MLQKQEKVIETNLRDKLIDHFITIISYLLLLIVVILVFIAVFSKNNEGEASIGSFDVTDYSTGWTLQSDGADITVIDLPQDLSGNETDKVTIIKTLPNNISDGMSLMFRASMENVSVYIDNELREEYSSNNLSYASGYLPSAYVVTKLNSEDSGKTIKIDIRFTSKKILNSVELGYGNDVWYPIFRNNLVVNLAALVVLGLGILLLLITAFFLHFWEKYSGNKYSATKYLSILMIDVALWILSESAIRQFIFVRPSLSNLFSYLSVELIGAFACMYFDAVQHRRYHKYYRIIEALVVLQLVVNIILHIAGTFDLYQTLIVSHIWTAMGIILGMVCIVKDSLDKEVRKYKITAIGMCCFLALALTELLCFYISDNHVFGAFICIGLILLMTFTVLQILLDEMASAADRVKQQMELTNNTIETIAGAIDARDEYTGGHSERVGIYAERLAREIAVDYGLSEEDIQKIRYIGRVHDIGKIGVADNVLNKAGRLTDEEFSLMKKHTEIGYDIMGATGKIMEGVLDGIRYHHERFDGKGYPDGLAGTDIPLVARILALADSYDAMTSNRVYRKHLSDEKVREELIKCAGTQFDPSLTESFVRLLDRGQLQVSTEDGMRVDENGAIFASAKLENRLQEDLLQQKEILNPSHVRMTCYIMKLMEKKNKNISILFYEINNEIENESEQSNTWNTLNACVKEYMTRYDMLIRYDVKSNVLVLIEKKEKITELMEHLEKLGAKTYLM